jgi:hypothetical protein
MQRTDDVVFRSIFSGLVAASVILASGCDIGGSGSSAYLISQRVFPYTGDPQEFVVPAGVTSISVSAYGASGGDGWNADGAGSTAGRRGLGGNIQATLDVTPGETLCLYVGGAGVDGAPRTSNWPPSGTGGWNGGGDGRTSGGGSVGGGGGGASDIRREAVQAQGQADGGTTTRMEDLDATFRTDSVIVGMYLVRGTEPTGAEYERITSVDSETQLTTTAFATPWTDQSYVVMRKCLDLDAAPTLADRILVAGGGGSGSGWCTSGAGSGGDGGDTVGASGELCLGSEDLLQCDPLPDLLTGGEIGLYKPFPQETSISPAILATTPNPACAAEDQGGIDNAQVSITNESGLDFLEVYYVADAETTITNVDGLLDGMLAFKIDDLGANTPLVSETGLADNVFQAGETWVFILQDYSNGLGLAASDLASIGIPTSGDVYSSGSIVGIVDGTGGTDAAGGWAGGAFGNGATQSIEGLDQPPNPVKFPFPPSASGAGGGGWYGGGASDGAGGGGGSSYVDPSRNPTGVIHQQGVRDGDGLIVIGTE